MKSPKPGNYATGGVVNGQGGFKKGGAIAKSGIINTENQGGEYRNTKMVTTKVDTNSAPTGGVKLGNAGGYKKGGATKKHFATGGAVNNSGHAVAMPKKPASKAVSNDRQSGTFKRGGTVKMSGGGSSTDKESFFDKNKVDPKTVSDKASRELEDAMNPLSMVKELYGKARNAFRGKGSITDKERASLPPVKGQGAVTETEKSITVSPVAKKRGGKVC
jgi:hypothetical protein